MSSLYTLEINHLNTLAKTQQHRALMAIESGKVLYLPQYFFPTPAPIMEHLFSPALLDGKHKNISFDYSKLALNGLNRHLNEIFLNTLQAFMQSYADFAKHLVETLFPQYKTKLRWGRTSYRPAEIQGRKSSKRKDDTRLHVDSFTSTPVNSLRILRVFCNINPYNKPRVWHLGEPFAEVLKQFVTRIPPYNARLAKFLQFLKITKTLRSAYDHYQLHLHDQMKLDDHYQTSVKKTVVNFPPQSTWVVFTDYVSHAALSGQFLLEQTFYLPVSAMVTPELSPLSHWEKEKQVALV